MKAFVSFAMRSRTHAMTVAAFAAASSLLVLSFGGVNMLLAMVATVLSYMSGAVIGLATLRYGVREGAIVIAGTAALAGLFTLFGVGTPLPALVFAVSNWVPVCLLSAGLRAWNSQGAVVTAAAALCAGAVVLVHLLLPDPAAWWAARLDLVFQPLRDAAGAVDPEAAESLREVQNSLAPVMTGLVSAGFMSGLILTILMARWWHALLDNPGGFAREFRELRLGTPLAAVVAVVFILGAFANAATGGLAGDLLVIAVTVASIQGLAVLHGVIAIRKASVGWLVLAYVIISILPVQAGFLLAVTGMMDNWLDFRGRAASGTKGT